MERRIIHIDMDAFFAQVEVRDNPTLKGKPVIIGGRASGRGVVSTASYEARKFGVHSAMPMAQAHKLCPDGYYVRPRLNHYREVSNDIMAIFKSYTDIVEPLSLDEAYLDVTELVRRDLPASMIAQYIQRDIYDKTHLTSSAGVSYNKFLAKLASGMNKPSGRTVIDYENAHDLLMSLSIGDFAGIGKVTEEKMKEKGIHTGKDLYQYNQMEMIQLFGKRGVSFYNKVRGIDHSHVKPTRIRKSIGRETTFETDQNDDDFILNTIRQLSGEVANRADRHELAGRTITVKLKTHDFETLSKQTSSNTPVYDEVEIYNIAYDLYNSLKDTDIAIRLVGVSIGNLVSRTYRNLTIYDFI
ncbi:DNA polymerase IV [Mammaliicoccus fleurettii]|uniref:DNA polymerase IV n=1 Tax=Mammaliicoccus fleurettii TaxID=150056 RepID=UPI002DBDBBEA|nr:DNA polymerase IV [Mammaliicoccus fleurettii]MEB7724998.1 DNA polymerase IV [Mammaliicoccus fleurettii]